MLAIIACPQRRGPVEITQRRWLDATDGPIQHRTTTCLSKHWRTPRAETAYQQRPATRSQRRDPAELLGPGTVGGARQHRRSPGQ
jgi:hypothetical protein